MMEEQGNREVTLNLQFLCLTFFPPTLWISANLWPWFLPIIMCRHIFPPHRWCHWLPVIFCLLFQCFMFFFHPLVSLPPSGPPNERLHRHTRPRCPGVMAPALVICSWIRVTVNWSAARRSGNTTRGHNTRYDTKEADFLQVRGNNSG